MGFLVLQGHPYWATLALTVPAAALWIRVFIFVHDCCHGSYFASDRANRILGHICGILTFTPFEDWRRAHAVHHATAGDLDRRGTGDVWTMTAEEYLAASPMRRVAYRILRNPVVLFGLVPAALSLVCHRFPHRGAGRRERRSMAITNLAIAGMLGAAGMTIGVGPYLSIQLPVAILAGTVGVWLFYVQHQYEGVYWARHQDWDPMKAALEGSSYHKLPKLLQWCTGSIGLHHIHHARPGVPNYNLQRCLERAGRAAGELPIGQEATGAGRAQVSGPIRAATVPACANAEAQATLYWWALAPRGGPKLAALFRAPSSPPGRGGLRGCAFRS